MTTESERIPCPNGCGQVVSSLPGPMAQHMKKCSRAQGVPPESKDQKPPEPEQTIEPKAIPANIDPAIKIAMERAAAAQQAFLKAPKVFVSAQTSDQLLELRKMYLPESVGDHATVHCFMGLESKMEQYAARGYEPVPHPVTGGLIRYEELVMFKQPIEMFKAQERRAQLESRSKIKRAADPKNLVHGAKGDIEGASDKGLTVEEFSAEKREI